MKSIILIAIILNILSCSSLPNSQQISTKYGDYVYRLSGEGSPAIILETGMGNDMTAWQSTIERFAERSQVFAYNRAGFQGSTSINTQRDGQTIALELRVLLKELNISPPYILVGHSLGGLYMKLFANAYPDDVAAVVFIDATHHDMREICKTADGNYCVNEIPWWAKIIMPDAVASEYKQLDRSLELSSNVKNFPHVPVVVLSSTKIPKGVEETDKDWIDSQRWQKYFTTLSPVSKQITCSSCGHHVHQDKPELVTEALDWVFEQLSDEDSIK